MNVRGSYYRSGSPFASGLGNALMIFGDYLGKSALQKRAQEQERKQQMSTIMSNMVQLAMSADSPGQLDMAQGYGAEAMSIWGGGDQGPAGGGASTSTPADPSSASGDPVVAPPPAYGSANPAMEAFPGLRDSFRTRREILEAQAERRTREKMVEVFGEHGMAGATAIDPANIAAYAEMDRARLAEEARVRGLDRSEQRREGRFDTRQEVRAHRRKSKVDVEEHRQKAEIDAEIEARENGTATGEIPHETALDMAKQESFRQSLTDEGVRRLQEGEALRFGRDIDPNRMDYQSILRVATETVDRGGMLNEAPDPVAVSRVVVQMAGGRDDIVQRELQRMTGLLQGMMPPEVQAAAQSQDRATVQAWLESDEASELNSYIESLLNQGR